jgi:hypothetical protein
VILPVSGGAEPDAVMRLVDDDQVPGGALQLLEDLLLLGEVDRGQAVGDMVEGVGAEDEAAA